MLREQQMHRAAAAAAAAVARHHALHWLDLSSYFPRNELAKRGQQQLSSFEAALLLLIREQANKPFCQPRTQGNTRTLKALGCTTKDSRVAPATPEVSNGGAAVSLAQLDDMPHGVRRAFSTRGIISLWDWQASLLSDPSIVLDRRNALVCLPSGSGKSVAADLLLLHTVLKRGRSALLVLPYQSGVHEKVQTYEGMVLSTDLWVESHDGLSPLPQLPSQQCPSLCVCT
jgi:hypothetical protein